MTSGHTEAPSHTTPGREQAWSRKRELQGLEPGAMSAGAGGSQAQVARASGLPMAATNVYWGWQVCSKILRKPTKSFLENL